MLVELMVENYAVIEKVRVRFHAGLNLLTGETGSGKSIVVDALGLLLGGRTSAEMVRTGAVRARVSGIFEVAGPPALAALLEAAGITLEDQELLVELERGAQEKLRLADLWEFQRKEIENVAPQAGEDTELENERRVLRNIVRLQESANAAYDALYESPESVTAQLRIVSRKLEDL